MNVNSCVALVEEHFGSRFIIHPADLKSKGEYRREKSRKIEFEQLKNVSGGSGPTDEDVTAGVRAYCGNCQRSVLAKPTGKDDGGFFQWRQYEYICPICNGTFWN